MHFLQSFCINGQWPSTSQQPKKIEGQTFMSSDLVDNLFLLAYSSRRLRFGTFSCFCASMVQSLVWIQYIDIIKGFAAQIANVLFRFSSSCWARRSGTWHYLLLYSILLKLFWRLQWISRKWSQIATIFPFLVANLTMSQGGLITSHKCYSDIDCHIRSFTKSSMVFNLRQIWNYRSLKINRYWLAIGGWLKSLVLYQNPM